MLWRALKHIDKGFYIDIGAAWPDQDSVTKAFYDRGWSGVNVEPNPDLYQQIVEKRLRDINLHLAVGNEIGDLQICCIKDTGLSTGVQSIVNDYEGKGFTTEYQQIKVITLEKIFEKYLSPGLDVHFLKIDVEGMEKAVLQGNDWSRFRPWIVLIESTLPGTQIENHGQWEGILYESKYMFAYADGINRFYIAQEHKDILSILKYPPNVFDDYILNIRRQSELQIQDMAVKIQEFEAKAEELLIQMQMLYASKSWRITLPLRWIGEKFRKNNPKKLTEKIKPYIGQLALYVSRKPLLKFIFVLLLNRFPTIKSRLTNLSSTSLASELSNLPRKTSLCELNHRAKKIYLGLMEEIQAKK